MVDSNKKSAAHHEAGHAVMCVHQDLDFKLVSIKPNKKDGSLGRIKRGLSITDSDIADNFEDLNKWDLRRKIEKEVMVTLAGYAGEKLLTQNPDTRKSEDDLNLALWLLDHVSRTIDERRCYLDYLKLRTDTLLNHPMPTRQVLALAEELLKQETLKAKKVRLIISKTTERLRGDL